MSVHGAFPSVTRVVDDGGWQQQRQQQQQQQPSGGGGGGVDVCVLEIHHFDVRIARTDCDPQSMERMKW